MTALPAPPSQLISCAGCGGRNPPDALECDWCGRPFVSTGRRLRLAGWQVFGTVLLLIVVASLLALGVLNAGRDVAPRSSVITTPAPSAVPTPAVTPRVTAAPSPTLRAAPTSLPAAESAPAPINPPLRESRIVNTGGQGVTVRAEPGPQAASLGTAREGTRVLLMGGEETIAARIWREVQDEARGLRGWVLSDYLELP